jgi:F0F1-type ATP synthase membrane subunit b/b'
MDSSETRLLQEVHKLTKQNNKMIEQLNRDARRGRIWRTIKTVVTLAFLFGAYYLVQPLIQNLTDAYTSIQNGFEDIQKSREAVADFSLFGGLKKDAE